MESQRIKELAQLYTHCIELEERAIAESSSLAEDLSILRADLHALWMQTLRDANIPFSDRTEAAHLAYKILINSEVPLKRS